MGNRELVSRLLRPGAVSVLRSGVGTFLGFVLLSALGAANSSGAPEASGIPLLEKGLTGVILYWPATGDDSLPRVQRVLEESPAERAGIRQGDYYTHADGQPLRGLPQEKVMRIIRGPAGTTVRLRVLRTGSDKPLFFEITRGPANAIRSLGGRIPLPR